jgi:hypothetical protein
VILALLTKLGIPQWLAELLLGCVVVGTLAGGSAYLGYRYKANADLVVQQQAELAHVAEMAKLQNMGQQVQAKFESHESQAHAAEATIIQEVPHVTKFYRPAPGAAPQPLPRAVFTNGFVRVWNDALDPGLPADPAPAAGAPAAHDPAGALDSGVTEADVLRNHALNAAECDTLRNQLNSIADWDAQLPKQAGDQ